MYRSGIVVVNTDCAIIKYARVGTEFQYFKLFLQTVSEYIIQYKNVEYDKLTDKDKSVVLARIIKSMEVNGYPVTTFFEKVLAKWKDKENFEKNQLFVEFMAKEIFSCYDKNKGEDTEFFQSEFLFYIVKGRERDYFEPPKPSLMESKFSKNTPKVKLYEYFLNMKKRNDAGLLTSTHYFA